VELDNGAAVYITIRLLNPMAIEQHAAVATGMTDGMEQSYQLLEQVLSEKPRA